MRAWTDVNSCVKASLELSALNLVVMSLARSQKYKFACVMSFYDKLSVVLCQLVRCTSGDGIAKIDRVLCCGGGGGAGCVYSGHDTDISLHTRKSSVHHVLLNVI